MPHNPTVRILPDADTAVLLIHGICGSPTQFRRLLPLEQMIPETGLYITWCWMVTVRQWRILAEAP